MGLIPRQAIDTSGRAAESILEQERRRQKLGDEENRWSMQTINVWDPRAGVFKDAYEREFKARLDEEKERLGYIEKAEKAKKAFENIGKKGINPAAINKAKEAYMAAEEEKKSYLERFSQEQSAKGKRPGRFIPDVKADPFAIFRKMEAGQLIPEFNRPMGLLPDAYPMGSVDLSASDEFYRRKRERRGK